MPLTLIYSGPIRSAQGNHRRSLAVLREQFHEQLVYSVDPNLVSHIDYLSKPALQGTADGDRLVRAPVAYSFTDDGVVDIEVQRGGNQYIPFFSRFAGQFPALALDITLFSTMSPQRVLSNAGDIDNRVKRLIDGMRLPSESEAAREQWHPPNGPCWVAMEDDGFITQLSVKQERLLGDARSDTVTAVVRIEVASMEAIR